ncbi:MAG: hypothetical protein WCP86_10215 [bacterium]
MKRLGRIVLLALAIAGLYLLLNGIGWAAIFFWKCEFIVWCVSVPSFVLCPLSAIEVVPGCSLDTPLYFIPMMAICFILWAWGIETIWNKKRKHTEPATATSSEPAARSPQR